MLSQMNRRAWEARYWILWVCAFLLLWQGFDINLRDAGIIAASPFIVLIAYHVRAIREKPFVRELNVEVPEVHLDEQTRELIERICAQVERDHGRKDEE